MERVDLAAFWRPAQPSEFIELDQLAGKSRFAGFMQSNFWAEFKKLEGFDVTRWVWADSSDEVRGSTTILRFPYHGESGFAVCPEGPVLDWDNESESREALRGLIEIAKQFPEVLGLRVEPHLPIPAPRVLRNWADAPTDLIPADTLALDLNLTEDELLAAAHPKCRYNLRIAAKHGVTVQSIQDQSFTHEFYALLTETSSRTGFYIEPFGFFLNLVGTLFKHNAAEFFVSRYEGEVLAAILVVYFGNRATYLYGGSSSRHRKVMPVYPLHVAAMNAARERHCTEYDMYGIDASERRDHLYAGITRFKKQWGGRVERRVGARDYVFYDRLADLVVKQIQSMPDFQS